MERGSSRVARFPDTLLRMAKVKRKRKRPGGGSAPAPPSPEAILAEIDKRAAEIEACDPDAVGPLWGAVHKLLLKTDADSSAVGSMIANRDVAALRRLLGVLRGEEVAEAPTDEPAPIAIDVPIEVQRKAMRAFRKRLKLIRLDHESKLGVGPMTGGKKADFQAIMPPMEFAPEVWIALVAAGRLEAAGPGFYMLAEGEAELQ